MSRLKTTEKSKEKKQEVLISDVNEKRAARGRVIAPIPAEKVTKYHLHGEKKAGGRSVIDNLTEFWSIGNPNGYLFISV